MGAFPPAVFLHETGFDIRSLLQEGNWWRGGANVHSLSLFTWFLAAVMSLTESTPATFVVVRFATFALVAGTLVLFSSTMRLDGLPAAGILVGASLLLCLPLVLVQVGYLYTETWVMAFSVAAWALWRRGWIATAVLSSVLALLVKLTGTAIVACIGVALLASLAAKPAFGRRLMLIPVLVLAVYGVLRLPQWLGAAPTGGAESGWGEPGPLGRALLWRLAAIPDVSALLVLGVSSSLIDGAIQLRRRGFRLLEDERSNHGAVTGRLICLAMPIAFSLGVAGSVFAETLFLPRYLVPVVPFLIGSVLFLAQAIGRDRIAAGLLLVFATLGIVNQRGILYLPEHSSFSVVERSHAYKDYLRVQIDLIDAITEAPPTLPVYVSREIDYMLSDPMIGYVDRKMPQVRPLYLPEVRDQRLDHFPAEFLLAYSNAGHGGGKSLLA